MRRTDAAAARRYNTRGHPTCPLSRHEDDRMRPTDPYIADTPPLLQTEERVAGTPVTAAIIWLHGLGADAYDFVPMATELKLPVGTRFVFPYAPMQPVTWNNGYTMPAWYDIYSIGIGARQDAAGIKRSAAALGALIAREHTRGVPYANIFLAGFSQGGALALHTGLRYPERLGGIVALSTYLPLHETIADEAHAANRDIPIFMAHGNADEIVPLSLGELSCQHLRAFTRDIAWHVYPMPHSVIPAEVADIEAWLSARLRAPTK